MSFSQEALGDFLIEQAKNFYTRRAAVVDPEQLAWNERIVLLTTIDHLWKEHLYEMDQLKEGIGLRGYGQRDPLVEYKRDGFELFQTTLRQINATTLKRMFRGLAAAQVEPQTREKPRSVFTQGSAHHDSVSSYGGGSGQQQGSGAAPVTNRSASKPVTVRHSEPKVGRNDPCPCGSGKKYKQCHGKNVIFACVSAAWNVF